MNHSIVNLLQNKTKLTTQHIKNIIQMLDEGCTIPFIARYRKDLTGNASDEDLREFESIHTYSVKLLKRKEEILNILKEKELLDEKLKNSILEAATLQNLEDIYSIFKEKKSSKTTKAIENGLEPLANILQSFKYTKGEINTKAKAFLNKNVQNISDAINQASDIIAQRYADEFKTKEIIRNTILNYGIIKTKPTKTFNENGVYSNLKEINEKVKLIKPHRFLALNRASNEKELTVKIDIDENRILENIKNYKIPSWAKSSKEIVFEAYKDGLKRLLLPSLKREALANLKEEASRKAIVLFGQNLKELLQTPPLVEQIILGMDPGYVSGCKLAVIDKNGERMHIPVGSLACLMLEPGTRISHAAVKLASITGTLLIWVGEAGVRLYSVGQPGGARSDKLLYQAKLALDENLRLKIVRKMFEIRFGEPAPERRSVDQLRGIEGARVRKMYQLLAKQYDVEWHGRRYDPKDWGKGDKVNQCLSVATSCLYGVSEAAILAAGYAPAIGFLHSGKPLSFVYDIADLIKFETVVPIAFKVASKNSYRPDRDVRIACREVFRTNKMLKKIIPLIEEVLSAGEIKPPLPHEDAQPPAIPEPESISDEGHRG